MQRINVSEFKAKCLAIVDGVARTGEEVTILRRGRPVARLLPILPEKGGFPQDSLFGTVKSYGDILSPVLPPEAWEAEKRRK